MREVISNNLVGMLRDKFGVDRSLRVLVIGGSDLDPEVINIKKNFKTEITYAGIETELSLRPYIYLDLNSRIKRQLISSSFEVIMCNQVFEHIFDLNNALKYIALLCKEDTIIWIDFPTSTFPHGSPDFYTSGIMPDMVMNLASKFDLETVKRGIIGSQRDYLFGHVLNVWPTLHQQRHPFWSYYGIQGSLIRKIIHQVKIIPAKILLSTASRQYNDQLSSATTGWIILKSSKIN